MFILSKIDKFLAEQRVGRKYFDAEWDELEDLGELFSPVDAKVIGTFTNDHDLPETPEPFEFSIDDLIGNEVQKALDRYGDGSIDGSRLFRDHDIDKAIHTVGDEFYRLIYLSLGKVMKDEEYYNFNCDSFPTSDGYVVDIYIRTIPKFSAVATKYCKLNIRIEGPENVTVSQQGVVDYIIDNGLSKLCHIALMENEDDNYKYDDITKYDDYKLQMQRRW